MPKSEPRRRKPLRERRPLDERPVDPTAPVRNTDVPPDPVDPDKSKGKDAPTGDDLLIQDPGR